MTTTNNGSSNSNAQKSYIELLIERAEKGTTSEAKIKKRYLDLVERSSGKPESKQRLIRICKVLDDWELVKLHLLMPDNELAYLSSLNLKANETYFVQANDRLQLDKFKSYYLLTDGTDFMPRVTDLATLVSESLGESEELNIADIERGMSNLHIIYIRKNMGLMGRGTDLYINQLLNHISFRRSKKRHTLILSEVCCRVIADSGEVVPILITNDKLRSRTGKSSAMSSLEPNKEQPASNSTQNNDAPPAVEDREPTPEEKFWAEKQAKKEKKARENARLNTASNF